MYNAVQTRTPSLGLAQVKEHLRIHPDYTVFDDELTAYLATAKEDADKFLLNPFTSNGRSNGTPIDIPPSVYTWVLKRVAQLRAWPTLGTNTSQLNGVGSTKGSLSGAEVPLEQVMDIIHLRDPAGLVGF